MLKTQADMSVFEAILAQRSVRNFTPQEVTLDIIHILLEAAMHVPTAFQGEPWAFAIIRDKQLLKVIAERAKSLPALEHRKTGYEMLHSADTNSDIFYGASTLVLICSKKTKPFEEADCWLAAENLALTACAMELGSCVISPASTALNMPDIKEKLNIPEEFSVIAPIVLGYPSNDTPPSPRKLYRVIIC